MPSSHFYAFFFPSISCRIPFRFTSVSFSCCGLWTNKQYYQAPPPPPAVYYVGAGGHANNVAALGGMMAGMGMQGGGWVFVL